MPLIAHRAGSSDSAIWNSVKAGEYRLNNTYAVHDVIIDIGCHIGSFADEVLSRGAGSCHCYEPDPELFKLASQNLSSYGNRAIMFNAPVWGRQELVNFVRAESLQNTGVGRVWGHGGSPVATVAFDDVVLKAANGGRVRLLKLDCEGSEWSILQDATTLSLIDEIVGEWHENFISQAVKERSAFTVGRELLRLILKGAGFFVELVPNPNHSQAGNFFARRK